MVLNAARLHIWPVCVSEKQNLKFYQSILCRSIVSSLDPTLSRINNLDCFFIISLVSVKLKSRLLTWHYLLRKHSMVIRPFSSEEGGVWARDYVAVTGVAWSELVNNRGHFWMVRQALHDSTM